MHEASGRTGAVAAKGIRNPLAFVLARDGISETLGDEEATHVAADAPKAVGNTVPRRRWGARHAVGVEPRRGHELGGFAKPVL